MPHPDQPAAGRTRPHQAAHRSPARGWEWSRFIRRGWLLSFGLPFVLSYPIAPTLPGALVPAPILPAWTAEASLESQVWRELNLARARPWVYADYLEGWLSEFEGTDLRRPGRCYYILQEGRPAVEEAIRYLRGIGPREPLDFSGGMSQGADDLVDDLGPRGGLSHVGLDGSEVGDRLNRYGIWLRKAGEVIQCGTTDPREIVALLIVDDGAPARPHRRIVFDADYQVMGAAIGKNSRYAHMCVITFAEMFLETTGDLPRN